MLNPKDKLQYFQPNKGATVQMWCQVVSRPCVMYSTSWEIHLIATWRHLIYGITQCYLPPDMWTHPALTPARQASTQFTYPGGMEGWVDLGSLNPHYATKPCKHDFSFNNSSKPILRPLLQKHLAEPIPVSSTKSIISEITQHFITSPNPSLFGEWLSEWVKEQTLM